MKSCISEGFIFVVLCASLASCSNLLKRPSDSTGPKNEKKLSSHANPPKSTSHHSNSLHSAIHSESLPYEGSEYLLSKSTFSDFSNANLISPAASSIELPLGTEPVVSHGPDKNSTPLYDDLFQSKTAKNCSSGAKSSPFLKQNQSSSSLRSVSLVKKQSSESQSEKETIKDLPYPTVQENSVQDLSTSRDQQPDVPRYVLVGEFWTLEWSLGILSFSQSVASPSKSLRRSFSYHEEKKIFSMYFGSENFNNLLYFKYAAQAARRFSDPESIFSENFKSKEIRKVFAVFSTFSSLPSHLLPFYYPFSFFYDTVFKSQDFARIPFYFLFTTISYLLKNEHNQNAQYLKPLLKLAYRKALDGNRFKSDEWNFLKNFLSQYFDISDLNFNVLINCNNIQFDISTISFIYHEMRFGSSEKVKSFFRQVWETSKQECSRKNDLQISKSPKIFIPPKHGISANIFEREARKLYQIEFTNLLLKEWNQMEDLLEEFAQLKFYFSNMIIDFRLRTFSADDFESLSNAMKHIYSLLEWFSFKIFIVRSFLIELEYFVNFKCFLFLFDLCNELKESGSSNPLYKKTFESIKSILESFESIRSISSKHFESNPINLDILRSNFNIQPLHLKTLIDKCFQLVNFIDIRLFDEVQDEFDEFFVQLKNYDYFDKKLNIFLPNILSRFKWAEFTDELNEILDIKNKEEIVKIFLDEKYENVRKVWNSVTKLLEISSIQNKKQYLELLKTYLILYNQ